MGATTRAAGMLVPANDGWAMLAAPPGERDLGLVEPWTRSMERSLRRRGARWRSPLARCGGARISVALAAVALGGPLAGAGPMAASAQAASARAAGLERGDHGARVRALQRALHVRADGAFGRGTERAVKAWQRAHAMTVTGRVGPAMAVALGLSRATSAQAAELSRATIRAVQRAVGAEPDGHIGPATRAAVRAFQQERDLPVTGRLDPATLQALGIDPETEDTTDEATSAAPSGDVQAAVEAAMTKLGAPYRSGGTGPGAFDCSGLVKWAMAKAGIAVPRTSFDQFQQGERIARTEIQAGDLVFFDTAGPGASDVGIATSATTAVSATTHGVMTHAILSGYWGSHYVGARRIG
jgi:peptidoglycan DL-endopeptidase CwlO